MLAPCNMFWGLCNWMSQFTTTWQLPLDFYENASIDDLAARTRARRPRLVWIETPANPTWDVTDIAAASALAREVGAAVAVDSTAATPVLTRPLQLGADIVMHSATKYLNGHSDVVAGALVTARRDAFWERIVALRVSQGGILGPLEAWLLLRGMRTLFVRVAQSCTAAQRLAAHFNGHPRLAAVLYPGL